MLKKRINGRFCYLGLCHFWVLRLGVICSIMGFSCFSYFMFALEKNLGCLESLQIFFFGYAYDTL